MSREFAKIAFITPYIPYHSIITGAGSTMICDTNNEPMNYQNTRTTVFDRENAKLLLDARALATAPRMAKAVTSKRSAKKPRQVAKVCRVVTLNVEKPGSRVALMQNGQWKRWD